MKLNLANSKYGCHLGIASVCEKGVGLGGVGRVLSATHVRSNIFYANAE